MKFNFVQDIAVPHNNVLIKAIEECDGLDVNLWYCKQEDNDKYDWKSDLRRAVKEEFYEYSPKCLDFNFIKQVLFNKRDEKLLVVGWTNINTIAILLLAWILRKPFNMWSDLPQDDAPRSKLRGLIRELLYFLARTSKAKMFCVGKLTIDYFVARGWDKSCLVNLPVFFELADVKDKPAITKKVRKQYGVAENQLFITTGSRLVHDKGYDLFIDALAMLPAEIKNNVKCVLVGKGEEEENLKNQAKELGVDGLITFEPWMDVEDFKDLLMAGDVFIHPARFDAFGGTLAAMAMATPVIGSTGAGAAIDRIIHGVNGYIFDNSNTKELAQHIADAYNNKDTKLVKMSNKAIETAKQWSPQSGAEIIRKELI